MSLLPEKDIVPVVTWHSVGMHKPDWTWSQLSERADVFERLLRLLHRRGYKTVTLSQLYDHMTGERLCEPKSVALVFDDGYLDNWVTVYPLLKKYGMTGTVYVNPDFVDPGTEVRPTIDDESASEISQTGFMNWAELRQADAGGVLDVQSHALTHTWYFTGPEIVDVYTQSTAAAYPWMAWNARPERKPFYLQEDQSSFVPWGTPVFEHEKSLVARRFFPDPEKVKEFIASSGPQAGKGSEFPGSYESEEDYQARVLTELAESKAIIERKLDKNVDFLCWPGGGANDVAIRMAAEAGYRSWTLPSRLQRSKRNRPGEDPGRIRRLPAMREVLFFGRRWGFGSERLVLLEMLAHQESTLFDVLRKVYKIGVAVGVAGQRS